MGLPALTNAAPMQVLVIPFGDPTKGPASMGDDTGHDLVFLLQPINGNRWDDIYNAHKNDEGTADWSDMAVDLFTYGVAGSVLLKTADERALAAGGQVADIRDLFEDFTANDAEELWTEWPEYIRQRVLQGVVRYNQTGSLASPLGQPSRT